MRLVWGASVSTWLPCCLLSYQEAVDVENCRTSVDVNQWQCFASTRSKSAVKSGSMCICGQYCSCVAKLQRCLSFDMWLASIWGFEWWDWPYMDAVKLLRKKDLGWDYGVQAQSLFGFCLDCRWRLHSSPTLVAYFGANCSATTSIFRSVDSQYQFYSKLRDARKSTKPLHTHTHTSHLKINHVATSTTQLRTISFINEHFNIDNSTGRSNTMPSKCSIPSSCNNRCTTITFWSSNAARQSDELHISRTVYLSFNVSERTWTSHPDDHEHTIFEDTELTAQSSSFTTGPRLVFT